MATKDMDYSFFLSRRLALNTKHNCSVKLSDEPVGRKGFILWASCRHVHTVYELEDKIYFQRTMKQLQPL